MGLWNIFKKKNEYVLTDKDLRWNKFIAEVCSKDFDALSEAQKNAVLCFWYDSEMNNGGHCAYFECHREVKPQQLIDAIRDVAYQEIADNFRKAVAEGEDDDWVETDRVYYEFNPSLCDCLMEYVERNSGVIFRRKELPPMSVTPAGQPETRQDKAKPAPETVWAFYERKVAIFANNEASIT